MTITASLYPAFLSLLGGLAAAGLTWYVATVARQITYVTLADGRRRERRLPLLFRVLLPLTPNLTRLMNRPVLKRLREHTGRTLVAAGFEGVLRADEFLSLRLLVPLVFASLLCALFRLLLSGLPPGLAASLLRIQAVFHLAFWALMALYPPYWLSHALAERHREIRRALPFTLDLLTLSVEAGMDFMMALQRTSGRRTLDALNEELLRVLREIQLGKTRREALRDLGERTRQPDLQSVVYALIQADQLGVSIGATLRIQSDQIRRRRFERAERLAHEAPVKLLFPLFACIFPAVFIVILGPIVMQLVRQVL